VPVDLAAGRKEPHALADEFRQGQAALTDHLQHQQPRNHAAIAVGELPEVVMSAHLTAIDAVDLTHLLLDESVPDLHNTGSPPQRRTISMVFQVRRGS